MPSTLLNRGRAVTLVALAVAIAAMGVYLAHADDAPGAAAMGLLLMLVAVVLAVRALRNRLPGWAANLALAVGVLIADFAAVLTHAVVVAAPLFGQPADVPSIVGPTPPSQWKAAADRARHLARAAIAEQNLPGLSVAVGVDGHLVWAEGFGWRDVETRTPVTPTTRFTIGTAASAVPPATVARLGLVHTGADAATEWSPEHVGEPEEDFPLFRIIRDVVFRPIGIGRAQPLAGERATFFVPRVDDNPRRGRRPMSMRDLACCADGGRASYSTPADLVRVGLAHGVTVDGKLAGGTVTSLLSRPDTGVVVAVTSNVAHAHTARLARTVADAFSGAAR